MKKFIVLGIILGSVGFVQAQDLSQKRREIAAKEVVGIAAFLDANNALNAACSEYGNATSGSFQDTDFFYVVNGTSVSWAVNNVQLGHLNAYNADAFCGTVLPALNAAIQDVADGNFNRNVMELIRR